MRLTEIVLQNLPPPSRGQKTYADEAVKGLYMRVSQGGTKTFCLMLGASRERITIGRYPIIKLAKARELATHIIAERTVGKHLPRKIAFDEAFELFIVTHLKQKNTPRTARTTEALIRNHFAHLQRRKLGEIRTEDITDTTDRLLRKERPGSANHAFAAIKTFLRWCVRRRYISHSPIEGLELPAKPGSRDRVLSDDELRQILTVARGCGEFGKYVELLILLGQRRTETASLHASWIDGEAQTITFPSAITKNKQEHALPFGPMVAAILATLPTGGLLFPGRSSDTPMCGFQALKASFDAEIKQRFGGMAHWTLHDLRRTLSTGVAKLGVLPHVKEMVLNHLSAKTDVERIYDRYRYLPEMRAAMLAWERHIASLMGAGTAPAPPDSAATANGQHEEIRGTMQQQALSVEFLATADVLKTLVVANDTDYVPRIA